MQHTIEQQLSQFGFDQKESKIYLAILELGNAKVADIAKKAGVERTTAYDILDKLAIRGLIGKYRKKQTTLYTAADPGRIKRQLEEQQQAFNHLLPSLLGIYNTLPQKPHIQFFEGIEGIKQVLEDTLSTRTKHLKSILSIVDLFTVPGRQFTELYVQRRIEANISLQVIRSKPKDVREYWPSSITEKRQLRYAPPSMIFSMTTYLYDNKVVIISSKKENFGMIIESEEYHQTMSHMFDALWQVSAPT